MRSLRTISSRRLAALSASAAVIAIAGGTIAQAALSSSAAKPAPKPLDQALASALAAPAVAGVTARIQFTNHLFSSAGLTGAGGSSALLSGASGRLWLGTAGKLRLELQSDAGDVQITSDGKGVSAYDASSNTVYRLSSNAAADHPAKPEQGAPSLAKIDAFLARLGERATVGAATPDAVGGQPAYSVRVSPKNDGGLLGATEVAWAAANGVPLRAAVYAQGDSSPVLELVATDVSFGSVAAADLEFSAPAGAKIVDLAPPKDAGAGTDRKPAVEGIDAVSKAVSFGLKAPAAVVGLPRTGVRLVDWKGTPSALVTYGHGLGQIAVLEQPVEKPAAAKGSNPFASLPAVSIDGASAAELATPLGTILHLTKGDASFTLAGSLPAVAAEAAARSVVR